MMVVALQIWKTVTELPANVQARQDLMLAMAHPLTCCVLAVVGATIWLCMTEECSCLCAVHQNLLHFFMLQVTPILGVVCLVVASTGVRGWLTVTSVDWIGSGG